MKTKIITIAATLFITVISSAQQIGNGQSSEITDFSAALGSGTYQGLSPIGMNPDVSYGGWQHLFVVRHSNLANNHQLQLSSSYSENDRLFFRKKAASVNPSWIELATRGTNNFVGDQIINGNLGIGTGTENPSAPLTVFGKSHFFPARIQNGGDARLFEISNTLSTLNFINNDYPVILKTGGGNQPLILNVARVGIGTSNPSSMLTVAGNIHSREVKVTVDAGADFVFEKDYNLPSLESVDKFIKQNKHLPEIASASEMQKDGINLSEMNIKLLKKIEELTLYSIDQNKKIETQAKEIESLKDLVLRVTKIESELARK